jgi:hypothetical protein
MLANDCCCLNSIPDVPVSSSMSQSQALTIFMQVACSMKCPGRNSQKLCIVCVLFDRQMLVPLQCMIYARGLFC